MRALFLLIIPAIVWVLAIFHRVNDLDISSDLWYSFPLLFTYVAIILAVCVIAVYLSLGD